jgi:adenylate cyclase
MFFNTDKLSNIFTKKVLKKFLIYTLTAFFIGFGVSLANIFFKDYIEGFDNQIRDYMFQIRGKTEQTGSVVIIDIDEKSLNELGQWPWPRNKVAKILENLAYANIGVIGLDIVFAEKDQSSPYKVLEDLNMDNSDVPNFDDHLNYIIQNTPTILGYQFILKDIKYMKKEDLDIPAIIVERNKADGDDLLINALGTVLNHKELQESGYSSGFFNNIPDDSGVIRSVPLVIRYDDQLYTSLALEIIRASMGVDSIFVNYSDLGIENIQIADFKIPTDKYGRFIVNYRGKSHTFKYYSAVDIYNGNFDPAEFDGKVALIGTTSAGLYDMRAMPFEAVYPGVEVHANIIDNIIAQDFLYLPTWIDGANIVIVFVLALLTVYMVTYTPIWINPLVMVFMSGITLYLSYYLFTRHGMVFETLTPLFTIAVATLVATLMDYFYEIRKENLIKNKFAAKVSKEVMENLLDDNDDKSFLNMNKEISVFFSNIIDFTEIAQAMPSANKLIEFLNDYMNPMSKIIISQKGTVDKFIGDAIMAYWNAPGDVENHADKAVATALKQLYEIRKLNAIIRKEEKYKELVNMCEDKHIEPISISIGINTGEAVIGEMGSDARSDYTIIGASVNLGAKLESLCKYYGTNCNISNFTKWQLKENYIFRFLDVVIVKGQSRPMQVWEVIDFDAPLEKESLYSVDRDRLDEELAQYHWALDLYQNGSFESAMEIFKELNSWEDKTNQKIYDIYIKRCEYFIKNPPDSFDGIFRFTS